MGSAIVVIFWITFITLLSGSIISSLTHQIGNLVATLVISAVKIVFSFLSATLLFAIIFKEIPEIKIVWIDVAIAAAMTGLVFTIINNIFGWYLMTFKVTTVVGAAGSLMLLFLWIFLIAEVLLYGAQFSKCYTETIGSYSKSDKALTN